MRDESLEPTAGREPRYMAGFTAIGIIVVAAFAYSVRITIDPGAGSDVLTATFLVANVIGWLIGSLLRRRDPQSVTGLLLVLLGDAIFPLNLYAPFMLYVPGLRGNAPATATAVIVIGIVYHLWNYQRRSSVRFALPFYPYFFALAGGLGLFLTQFTLGLPSWLAAVFVLAYAAAFSELAFRRRPEPEVHFGIAAATILFGAIAAAAYAYLDRNPLALAAIVAATLVAIFSALRERNTESIGRAHGLAAWLGVTATFTALLYAAHSEPWVYLVATGAWTIVLVFLSTRDALDWSDPFHESAWWAATALAIGLGLALWKIWMPSIVRTMTGAAMPSMVTIALLLAAMAMAFAGMWRRRHPTIASTMGGFVGNNVLLRISSYAAPLLFVLVFAGAWTALGAPAPANVYALLAAGMLLLIVGPMLERHYPPEALDFAGVLAMIFSAFNALESRVLSAAVLFAAALVYLVRYARGASRWAFYAFLVLTISGLALQRIGTPEATIAYFFAAMVLVWSGTVAKGGAARIAVWLGHAAGFIFWLSLARTLGYDRMYDAAVLALAAWSALVAYRSVRGVASRTSLYACIALTIASFVYVVARDAAFEAVIVALVLLGALLLELPNAALGGFALLIAALVVAGQQSDTVWLVGVLLACSILLLRRSLAQKSALGHLLFIATAVAAAFLAMPKSGALQTIPFVALVAVLLVLELFALGKQHSSPFHADVSSVIALVLAVTVLAAEVASTRFSIVALGALLLTMLIIRPWIAASETHRVQPVAHALFRAAGIVATAIVIVAVTRMAGLTPAQQLVALALVAAAVLAWLLRIPRGTAGSMATAVALHVIAIGVYIAAYVIRNGDPLILVACAAVAAIYFVWRAAWSSPMLEHLAGIGIVLAICLWGLAERIDVPDFYIAAVAAYLCVVIVRGTAGRYTNALAIITIVAAAGYPCYALLRDGRQVHLVFLGIAAVALIHVLLTTRRSALMVLSVCALLAIGMVYSATALNGDVRLNLLMAAVGFLVIADLGLVGIRSGRRRFVEGIGYDSRVAR